MSGASELERALARPRTWLVTGAAGFIGSHLVEELLRRGQIVRGLDDFRTGSRANLSEVEASVGPEAWARFELHESDVRDGEAVTAALEGAELVLHQAALGSVPRSLADPAETYDVNVRGTFEVLRAARDTGAARVVLASSSSVYGDDPRLPRREECVGLPLSPYAASKRMAEMHAEVFERCFGLVALRLRYFNVFGPRQDPSGPYAAVIPRWVAALVEGREVVIHGDGETSRDFCPVANVVRANLLAATAELRGPERVFNVGCGERTTLTELFRAIRAGLVELGLDVAAAEPSFSEFRPGDVRRSEAATGAIRAALGFEARVSLREGLRAALAYYATKRRGLGAGRRGGRTQPVE